MATSILASSLPQNFDISYNHHNYDNTLSSQKHEIEKINVDSNTIINFWHNYNTDSIITKYGNKISSVRQTISGTIKKKTKKRVSSSKSVYNKSGQETHSSIIDGDGKLKIKTSSDKSDNGDTIGYKAARTQDDMMCVVKLLIPSDAKVAFSDSDKYRANKVKVLDIREIYCDDKNIFMKCYDKLDKKCSKCMKNTVKYIDESSKEYCSSCAPKNSKNINKLLDCTLSEPIKKCDSCVHTRDFEYKKDQWINIPDFNSNLDEVCVPGIHYQRQAKDIFNWFGSIGSRFKNIKVEPEQIESEQIELDAEKEESKIDFLKRIKKNKK